MKNLHHQLKKITSRFTCPSKWGGTVTKTKLVLLLYAGKIYTNTRRIMHIIFLETWWPKLMCHCLQLMKDMT